MTTNREKSAGKRLLGSLAVLSALTVAGGAFAADPPKPRVMVILDTSRSMQELPKFTQPTDADIVIPLTAPKGDYDPTVDNDCDNKFCAAKKVVYKVIPQYTEDARIGFTTYFQWVLEAERRDTRETICTYDVIGPPGQLRTYRSYVDFMPGSPLCPGGPNDTTCSAASRAVTFPDDTTNTGSGDALQDQCQMPSGYSSTTDPANPGKLCSSSALNCYQVTKVAATPSTPLTCSVATWPLMALPKKIEGITGCTATTYSVDTGARELVPASGSNYFRHYEPASITSCAGTVRMPTTALAPTATPDLTWTTTTYAGTTTNTSYVGRLYRNGNEGTTCSPSAPCSFFLASATPGTVNTNRAWYGFFTNVGSISAGYNAGGARERAALPYTFGDRTTASPTTHYTINGALTYAGTAACPTAGLVTTGSLADYGFANALGAVTGGSSTIKLSGRTNESPTLSGTTFNCTPGWPCNITFINAVDTPGAWTDVGVIYSGTAAVPAGQRRGAQSSNSFTMRANNGATSCPAASTLANTTSPTSAPTGFEWTSPTSGPTGCGSGLYTCTFGNPSTGSATAPSGQCTNVVMNNGQPYNGTCSFNGKTYAQSGAATTINVTKQQNPGTTCSSSSVTLTSASQASSGGYAGCNSYPCTLTYKNQTAGSPFSTGWLSQNDPPTSPINYSSGSMVEQARTTPSWGPQSASSSITCSTAVEPSTNTTLCQGASSCLLKGLGAQMQTSEGCGAEGSSPCYACKYQYLERKWSLPGVQCNYTAPQTTWAVNQTATTCTYTRQQWRLEEQLPPTRQCNYTAQATRYDFTQPTMKYCEYWALKSTVSAPRTLFTYQYLTKGTEIVGRGSKTSPGLLCGQTYTNGSPFEAACPAQIAGCSGVAPLTSALGPSMPANSTCRLQWGGTDSTTAVGKRNGRYTSYKSNNTVFANGVCESNEASLPASPNSYRSAGASVWGFCDSDGSPASMSRYLVSDWYSPATTNDVTAYNALFPPADYDVNWTNTTAKTQGFGAKAGTPTTGSGKLPAASIFVPIPSDATYSASAQRAAIEAAASKCVPPGTTPPGPDGQLAGGACVSDFENATAPGVTGVKCSSGKCSNNEFKSCSHDSECWPWQDFTPLYGALKSTHEYLDERWQQEDPDGECRDYFIVLATDGAENTPEGYTVNGASPTTSVQGLVNSFRESSVPRTRPDVKTFVIAFGENIGSLDSVAAAGGTNQAFTANSLSELQTALQAVFTTITQGVYSRSRPALATDGQRLYAAQFIRPSGTPDWSGMLTAYRVDVTGAFSSAWEMGAKMNNASHPTRDISVGLRKKADDSRVVGPFAASNGELLDQLNDDTSFPSATMTSSSVIDFLREKGHDYAGGTYTRSSALGPLVSSAPVVVAKSPYASTWGGASTAERDAYATFIQASEGRPVRVLFQANDGMLHAASEGETAGDCQTLGDSAPTCTNGREAWAFVPGSLYRGYSEGNLANALYRLKEGSWNEGLLDGTLSVADVCASAADGSANCTDAADWKTLAIGTQRKGGRGMYAVDVTDGQAPNSLARWSWDFFHDKLGFTYSVPAIGRVRDGGKDYFIAFFGGGVDDPHTGDTEGNRLFFLKAVNGDLIRYFSSYREGPNPIADWIPADVVARPAVWQRPNSTYMDSGYIGMGSGLYTSRFAKGLAAGGNQHDDHERWRPEVFFEPTSVRNKSRPDGSPTPVNEVTLVPGSPPTYALSQVDTLPLSSAPTVQNRPKLGAMMLSSGAVPDLYVGTGDTLSPETPGTEFSHGNYFYAVHDQNQQAHDTKNDGVPMWVVRFPGKEQVVSEPAIISGCIVVATYTPPSVSTGCGQSGDTTLYGFHPTTGALTNCLVYPESSTWAGTSTSVVKLEGVGIPSDLIVVNDNVYMSTSEGGLQRAPVRQLPRAGSVRSYRRLK